MQDLTGRTIDYLRLSVTDLCNYRCRYCMPAEGVEKRSHAEICSLEELARIGRAAIDCGIRKIRLTGGEPLVRRGVVELCRQLKQVPGLQELTLTTNGSLLPELAGPLRQAGVDRLNISVDTLRPERFARITRVGSFAQVQQGLQAAKDAGFTRTKLNVVLIGGENDDEIADFVELTRDDDYCIRFIELMPIGECSGWDAGCFLPAAAVLERVPQLQKVGQNGVSEVFQVPGYCGTVGLIRPMSNRFCSQCNRIRVTADGKLKPCLHSDEEIPLRGLDDAALRQTIAEAIAHKPARHYLTEEHCSASHRRMHEIGG